MKQELIKLDSDIVAELTFWTDLPEEDYNKKWHELLTSKGYEKKGDLYYKGDEVLTYDSEEAEKLHESKLKVNYKLSEIKFFTNKDEFQLKDLSGRFFRELQKKVQEVENEGVEITFNEWDA